jgi:hypothetical protein
MNRGIILILTPRSYFTTLPIVFLFINNLTMHKKRNNVRFMNLFMLYDFMQVLNIKRIHYTKNEYFPEHILFTTVYL